jgi:hypothetical protein
VRAGEVASEGAFDVAPEEGESYFTVASVEGPIKLTRALPKGAAFCDGRWMRARFCSAFAAIVWLAGCGHADDPSGGSTGTGAPPRPEVAVITAAPANQWSFVPVDGMICGTGTPTGIGVNPSPGSKKLVIFLEGGGACFDVGTCTGPMPSASHFTGFGAGDMAKYAADDGKTGIFDRNDTKNPLRDANWVFVPYCTGDVHIGNKVSGNLHFVGQPNLKEVLEVLPAAFVSPDQVVLAGSSAGGFGTMWNFFLVDDAFGGKNTTFVDDSGPMLPLSAMMALKIVLPAWGLQGTAPPGCDKCVDQADNINGGPHNLIPYYATKYPGRRGSLLSSLRDKTISSRFYIQQDALEKALGELADKTAPLNKDFHVYYLSGEKHVWLRGDGMTGKLADVVSHGVSLDVFLTQQLTGASGWKDVRP